MLDRAGTLATASPRRSLAIVVAVVFIGLLAASYSLMQFLFAPLLGNLSDERGRRPVLLLSLAGSAVAWVLFGLGALFASDPVVTAAAALLPAFVPTTAFSLPSFAAAGFSLLAFLAAAAFLPEPPRKRGTAVRQGIVSAFRSALADPDLRPLVVVFLITSVAFSGV